MTAGKHFNELLERHGSPVVVINLVKKRERRKHESLLSEEFTKQIRLVMLLFTMFPSWRMNMASLNKFWMEFIDCCINSAVICIIATESLNFGFSRWVYFLLNYRSREPCYCSVTWTSSCPRTTRSTTFTSTWRAATREGLLNFIKILENFIPEKTASWGSKTSVDLYL